MAKYKMIYSCFLLSCESFSLFCCEGFLWIIIVVTGNVCKTIILWN